MTYNVFGGTLNLAQSNPTWVSRYQKGKTKTNMDFLEQETVSGSGNSWAFLQHDAMLVCAIIMCPSICLSVCLSYASIVSKWLHTESRKQYHTIAQGLWFSEGQRSQRNSNGVTQWECQMQVG